MYNAFRIPANQKLLKVHHNQFSVGAKMGWTSDEGLIVDIFERCCKIPRAVGVYPYISRGKHILVSKFLVVYDLFLAVLIIAFDCYWLINEPPLQESGNHTITHFIRSAQLTMTCINVVMSSIWILWNKTKLQEMLDELVKFEDIIKPNNFKVCNKGLIAVVLLLTGLIVSHFIVNPISGYTGIAIYIRFQLAVIMIFSNAAFFTRCTRITGSAYFAITAQLSDSKTYNSMKDIQKAMEHLVSASEALNTVFGPQLLSITSTSFVLNTGNTYLAITSNSTTESLVSVIWVIILSKLMLHIIQTCSWTTEKAKELDKTFYRTVLEDKTGDLSQEVRVCLHFTNNRKIAFTACGFFTIDFTLAGSMIAAATTYLVILIQIGGSEKSGG
ncbi:hypothetical protein GE061_014800 [Apolygus lucorum]|uniref:Gustatory receptor n=1 Tax=Apolygus lucorum TaxID=248454 RepID=A0A8S9XJA9_APOLU|nr:hypothetical protein GE061_014800 [Apolygus lucorum]